ncbi:hypothetical protein FPZ54_02305 [Sphingomonas suaedae]|uniref:YtxH domain-containing protein n=1 Tax=Sphingomonas suaedae TaxID=2599297 RepID=A0A518RBZ0_9SPHN|nr:hypothetical protein [Sphingomonas suaedae]QDX24977.1 hypothetical protein FPZ54_02305 [Sphingomonas suaedae]
MTDTQQKTGSSRAETIENNPLALVAGGVALGVVIGALIPRPQKEKELLAPVGKRIAEGASAAATAAREAGKAEIDALLPQRDAAKEQIGKIIGSAVTAAKEAASSKADA